MIIVQVTPTGPLTLEIGQTAQLTGVSSNNGAVTFVSSNPAVATVNSVTGLVTAVSPGAVTITATTAATPAFSAAEASVVVFVLTRPEPIEPAVIGRYPSTTAVKADPAGHDQFVQLVRQIALEIFLAATGPRGLAVANGETIVVTGPAGSNWVRVSGAYEAASRSATLTGTGTVAGRSNVSVRFTVTFTASGQMSGDYAMGVNGELPGGQAITYRVEGQLSN